MAEQGRSEAAVQTDTLAPIQVGRLARIWSRDEADRVYGSTAPAYFIYILECFMIMTCTYVFIPPLTLCRRERATLRPCTLGTLSSQQPTRRNGTEISPSHPNEGKDQSSQQPRETRYPPLRNSYQKSAVSPTRRHDNDRRNLLLSVMAGQRRRRSRSGGGSPHPLEFAGRAAGLLLRSRTELELNSHTKVACEPK